jgi:DNA-binding HxlR family transcriptional regulator
MNTHPAVEDWSSGREQAPSPDPDDVFALLQHRWVREVVLALDRGPAGHSQLTRTIADIPEQMVAQTLHRLERSSLVEGRPDRQQAPRRAYRLTTAGAELALLLLGAGALEPGLVRQAADRKALIARGEADGAAREPAGGIQAAVATMVSEALREHEDRLAREAVRHLINVTDGMIAELEALNLREEPSVPEGWQARLILLLASLPFEPKVKIPARPSPTQVLDFLFDIQQVLFDRKNEADELRASGFVAHDAAS